jgi:hypothetical protein
LVSVLVIRPMAIWSAAKATLAVLNAAAAARQRNDVRATARWAIFMSLSNMEMIFLSAAFTRKGFRAHTD